MTKSNSPKRKRTCDEEKVEKIADLTIRPGDFVVHRTYLSTVYQQISQELIGEGTYGKIVKMKHLKTEEIRACKVIQKSKILNGFTEEDILNEIEILKSLDHMNII